MRLFKFPGGVHPRPRKESTENRAIVPAPLPALATVFFAQHIGKPANPLVEAGDLVKTGQLIGEPAGFISAAVHSPLTGKVRAVSHAPHPRGGTQLAAMIEAEGEDEWLETEKVTNWQTISREQLVDSIRRAGIVGLGGATFPTAVKLSPPQGKKIDTLVINGAECEPQLTADARLMEENPGKVVTGIKILQKILDVRQVVIGIEDNKPRALTAMRTAADLGIHVLALPTQYPQGGEKQLIYALLGREVPSGALPLEVGVVVQNVGTAYAVCEAVTAGRPLVERVVTVTGSAVARPGNCTVRIGTPIRELFENAGGNQQLLRKIVVGGPMMGLALDGLEYPVTKGTSGLLFLSQQELNVRARYPCIRCGRCGQVCPMKLQPRALEIYTEAGELEQLCAAGLLDCMECGSCSYTCPANRELVQMIQLGKAKVRAAQP